MTDNPAVNKPVKKVYTYVCRICGNTYDTTRKHSKTCGTKCRMKFKRQEDRRKAELNLESNFTPAEQKLVDQIGQVSQEAVRELHRIEKAYGYRAVSKVLNVFYAMNSQVTALENRANNAKFEADQSKRVIDEHYVELTRIQQGIEEEKLRRDLPRLQQQVRELQKLKETFENDIRELRAEAYNPNMQGAVNIKALALLDRYMERFKMPDLEVVESQEAEEGGFDVVEHAARTVEHEIAKLIDIRKDIERALARQIEGFTADDYETFGKVASTRLLKYVEWVHGQAL